MSEPLQKLSAAHLRAMELRLEGLTYPAIGEEIHRSKNTIAQWFIDPLFVEEYQRLCAERTERARASLFEASPAAAERIRQLMHDRSGMVSLLAAKDVLDRVGLKPTEKIDQNTRGETQVTVRYVDQDIDGQPAETASGPTPPAE